MSRSAAVISSQVHSRGCPGRAPGPRERWMWVVGGKLGALRSRVLLRCLYKHTARIDYHRPSTWNLTSVSPPMPSALVGSPEIASLSPWLWALHESVLPSFDNQGIQAGGGPWGHFHFLYFADKETVLGSTGQFFF